MTKCMVVVREIAQRMVEDLTSMSCNVEAVPDAFLNEPEQRKRVQFTQDGQPYITIASYGWCDLWNGKPVYESSYH